MLGSATFDLVLGMVFIFMMLSLVVSAVREAIEARLKARAKHLAHGLFELLGTAQLHKAFYEHPLIRALYDGSYDASIVNYTGHRFFSWISDLIRSIAGVTNMPSYIPARTFALTLVDLARNKTLSASAMAEAPAPPPRDGDLFAPAVTLIDQLRADLQSQAANSPVARALLAALAPIGNDVDKGMAAIQDWYDGAMDRVSGWFKRDSQHILFWLGIMVAVSLHVDSIYLVKFLAANADARKALTEAAVKAPAYTDMLNKIDALRTPGPFPGNAEASVSTGTVAADAATVARTDKLALVNDLAKADVKVSNAIQAVIDMHLPIGWNHTRWNDFIVFDMKTVWTVFGWILTAFAVSFGAPFWFDFLNKIMVVRSTVKPHEKSPEEASDDRQRGAVR